MYNIYADYIVMYYNESTNTYDKFYVYANSKASAKRKTQEAMFIKASHIKAVALLDAKKVFNALKKQEVKLVINIGGKDIESFNLCKDYDSKAVFLHGEAIMRSKYKKELKETYTILLYIEKNGDCFNCCEYNSYEDKFIENKVPKVYAINTNARRRLKCDMIIASIGVPNEGYGFFKKAVKIIESRVDVSRVTRYCSERHYRENYNDRV